MSRNARVVIPDFAHHVTQRGNNQQDVFFSEEDRRFYLELLKREATRFGVTIQGYCLMTNHVHLIATPRSEDSLARAIGRTDYRYAQTINRRYGRSGHLWQNRFYSCALDPAHLKAALRYVEINPVRARLVRKPWLYCWSSAEAHVEGRDSSGLLDMEFWDRTFGMSGTEWQEWLMERVAAGETERLRLHTHRGRPLGSEEFLSQLEARLGKRLRPLKVGRPKHKNDELHEVK